MSLSVVAGKMDGTDLQILKAKSIRHSTSIATYGFQVYWVNADIFRQRIEHTSRSGRFEIRLAESSRYPDYTPQRIFIGNGELYWVGKVRGNDSEAILRWDLSHTGPVPASYYPNAEHFVAGNLTGVNSLTMYDAESEVNTTQGAHTCADDSLRGGVRLGSLCICPVGFDRRRTRSGGYSCQGWCAFALQYCQPSVLWTMYWKLVWRFLPCFCRAKGAPCNLQCDQSNNPDEI